MTVPQPSASDRLNLNTTIRVAWVHINIKDFVHISTQVIQGCSYCEIVTIIIIIIRKFHWYSIVFTAHLASGSSIYQ